MAEHVLRGDIALYPRTEGGRHLLIQDSGEVYRIPLVPEAVARLALEFTLTDDELIDAVERRNRARDIIVPNGHVQ